MKKINGLLAAALCLVSLPSLAGETLKISSLEVYFECRGTTPVLSHAINSLVNIENRQYQLPEGVISAEGNHVFLKSKLGQLEIATLANPATCTQVDGQFVPSKNLLVLNAQLDLIFSLDENKASCEYTVEQGNYARTESYSLISQAKDAVELYRWTSVREFSSPVACSSL